MRQSASNKENIKSAKNGAFSRIKNRLPLFFVAVLLMLTLAGCSAGSNVDTTLILNQDLSGVRQMTIKIDSGVFGQYFNGTIEDINTLLESQCPKELKWNYDDSDGNMRYDMTLEFSSVDDYKKKVAAITGSDPEIRVSLPDSVWASGISYEESFTSLDLLNWMKDLLVNNQFVDSSNAGKIFNAGSTSVTYNDQNYGTGNNISLNQMSYVSLDSIHILTDINEDGSFQRKVVVRVPAASMSKKGDEIKAYLNGVVPAGATAEWGEEGGLTIFTVSASNLTAEQLAAFDRTVFDTEDVSVSAVDMSESYSPFTFANFLSESVNLESYISENPLPYSYQVKAADSYMLYRSYDGTTPGEQGTDSETFPGYQVLREDRQARNRGAVTFSTLALKAYSVKELRVETQRPGFGSNWKRTSSFVFAAVPSEAEQELIVQRLQERAGLIEKEADPEDIEESEGEVLEEAAEDIKENAKAEAKSAEVTISGEAADGVYTLSVEQKGKTDEISRSSEILFGSADRIFYAVDRGFAKVNRADAFSERVSFGDLLTNTADGFQISYTAKLGMFSGMSYCSLESAEMNGGNLAAVFNGNRIDITYAGTKLNLWGLLFWILIVVGIASVVILLVKLDVFGSLAKKTAAAKEAKAAAVQTAAATPGPAVQPTAGPAETVQPAAPEAKAENTSGAKAQFCEKCGAPRVEGSRFCEKCGARFED